MLLYIHSYVILCRLFLTSPYSLLFPAFLSTLYRPYCHLLSPNVVFVLYFLLLLFLFLLGNLSLHVCMLLPFLVLYIIPYLFLSFPVYLLDCFFLLSTVFSPGHIWSSFLSCFVLSVLTSLVLSGLFFSLSCSPFPSLTYVCFPNALVLLLVTKWPKRCSISSTGHIMQ